MYEELRALRSEFEKIFWPEEFIVVFTDGKEQVFVSSQGVSWDDGFDLWDENEGRPSISACWKKKSPTQQRFRHIEFFVDKVREIREHGGQVLWRPKA